MSKLLPLCLLVLVASCRPTNKGGDSGAKSLDNLGKAPSAQTVNECGINYTGSEALSALVTELLPRIEAEAPYKNAVIGAVTAVPDNLLYPFVKAGGKIVVSVDAKAKCKDTPFSEAEQKLTGTVVSVPACWKTEPGAAPAIYLSPSVKLVRHDIVRLFAYFYTEAFVAKLNQPTTPAPFNDDKWKVLATSFVAERDVLAANFMLDLEKSDKALHDGLTLVQTADPMRFGNFVFAEALDSYYCSQTARANFASGFNLTYQRFVDAGNANSVVNQFGKR